MMATMAAFVGFPAAREPSCEACGRLALRRSDVRQEGEDRCRRDVAEAGDRTQDGTLASGRLIPGDGLCNFVVEPGDLPLDEGQTGLCLALENGIDPKLSAIARAHACLDQGAAGDLLVTNIMPIF